jgi:pimeloyl-ACP methyl ester carboxylesterase
MTTSTITTKQAELPNGLRLPYTERGDPAGAPPLLLLHGYTDSWRSFAPLLPHLPASIRAIAPTMRGHGDASRPDAGYGAADLAADLAAFADALGLGPAVVLGHSMGSQVARRFAADHPARVRGLVLVGAFASLHGNAAARALWDGAVSTLEDPIDPGFVRAFQESTVVKPVPPALLETAVAESLKVPARVWRAALAAQMEHEDPPLGGGPARVQTPALILWGDRDAIATHADQETLLAAMPRARLVVYAGVGHAPHWEEPARVAADVAAFAAGLAGRA